jgi:hypothetical protein
MMEFTLACAGRETLAGFADDALAWAAHPGGAGPVSYIAAHAAGLQAGDWFEGFRREREWQAGWLSDRLGVDA